MQLVSLAPSLDGALPERSARLDPVLLLHVSVLALVISNLGRIPFFDLGDREAPILISDIAAGAVVMGGALAALARRSLRLDRVTLVALLFAGIGALSALAAVTNYGLTAFELAASLAYLARWLLYFSLYVVVINNVRWRNGEGVWSTLETAILLFAAFGVVQAIFLPDFARMVYPDQVRAWDAQKNRLVSTVLDPNIAAAMILTVLLPQLARVATGARVQLWKPALLLVAMVLTLSRSGALSLVVGGGVILFARGMSKRLMRFAAFGLVAMVAALPKLIAFAEPYQRLGLSDASAAQRLIVWSRALATLWDNLWFGIGFNTFAFVQEHRGFEPVGSGQSYSAEGGLLFIAVMTGLVGLAVFVAMLWLVLRRCRAGWTDPGATPEERGLCIGVAAVTVAILVDSVFVNSMLVPFVMQPMLVLWGLVHVARSRMRSAGAWRVP